MDVVAGAVAELAGAPVPLFPGAVALADALLVLLLVFLGVVLAGGVGGTGAGARVSGWPEWLATPVVVELLPLSAGWVAPPGGERPEEVSEAEKRMVSLGSATLDAPVSSPALLVALVAFALAPTVLLFVAADGALEDPVAPCC